MARITVTAYTERWTTRKADPNDRWDNGDTEGRISEVVAYEDLRDNVHYYGESASQELDGKKAGDTVYAVVADYESGSTFGRSGGHAQVLDVVATLEEAEGLFEAARGASEGGEDSQYDFTYNGKGYNRSWVGHFEELQGLDIWELVVRRNPGDPYKKGPGRYSLRRN